MSDSAGHAGFRDPAPTALGIRFAASQGVEGQEAGERNCRMWLLAIAILHWLVFALMVHNSMRSSSEVMAQGGFSLAAVLRHLPGL